MTKTTSPEAFLTRIANASSDTAAMRLLMKAEATLSAEDFATLTALLKEAGL